MVGEITKAKFITRFRAHELSNDETLFPLYNTNFEQLIISPKNDTKRIILIQYEKGLIGKYHLETDHFDRNDLQFEVTGINHLRLLSGLNFQGTKLLSKLEDTVVVGTKVIVID